MGDLRKSGSTNFILKVPGNQDREKHKINRFSRKNIMKDLNKNNEHTLLFKEYFLNKKFYVVSKYFLLDFTDF